MLLAICLWGISGSVASAALVTCGTANDSSAATNCTFVSLITMINEIIKYLIMIAMPLAAISFAYAGWLYLSAGDDTGKVTKARTIFTDVGIGLIIVLSGWLVFHLIQTTFLNTDAGYGTYLK